MMQRWRTGILGLALALALGASASAGEPAGLKVPAIFGDNMVLQRDQKLPVWGVDKPGQEVTVTFGDATATAKADAEGNWKVELPAQSASSEGRELVVKGSSEKKFGNVLVGEVWLASGQSNMEWRLGQTDNSAAVIAAANHPRIRQIKVTRGTADFPGGDIKGSWAVCTKDTAGNFTGVGYYFAVKLEKDLDVPVGIINSSWGGTRIEPWTPPVGFAKVPELKDLATRVMNQQPESPVFQAEYAKYLASVRKWADDTEAALAAKAPVGKLPQPNNVTRLPTMNSDPHQQPTTLYNAMIFPIVPYAIRGAIWYQGESNRGEGMGYIAKQKALVEGWRSVWNADLAFYYVQLAPYTAGNAKATVMPMIQFAQAEFMKQVPNTGMAVISDTVKNFNDIHPTNKKDVGERLALQALAKTYGKKDLVADGPIFKSMKAEGDALRLEFDNVGGGLATRDGKAPSAFEMMGDPFVGWKAADARLDGNTVVLTAAGVKDPVAARLAWTNVSVTNLMNKEGLPASAFTEGDVKKPDPATDYKLVYDLDLNTLGGENIKYAVNNSGDVGAFTQVGYFLELVEGGKEKWIWVSADAFTDKAALIGVPTFASGAKFHQEIKNMTVLSNVEGIVNGQGFTGWMEFWSNNYNGNNSKRVPNANNDYDWGDTMDTGTVNGYGSMQLHNPAEKQVLMALNSWKSGAGRCDLGIGNNTTFGQKKRDYTFSNNGGVYSSKRLRIYVK